MKTPRFRYVQPRILMYHSVADGANDPYAVTPGAFTEQVSWLAASRFDFVSLASLLRLMKAGDFRALRDKVVLTFDDGYADFACSALPVLLDWGATATVFLVTGMLGGRASWSTGSRDRHLLSRQEVRYIKKQGISLGSHTASHADLTTLDAEELNHQLVGSREALDEFGEAFHSLSYPWGRCSERVLACVRSCGYECAVAAAVPTTMRGADPYLLPRIAMRADMSMESFRSLLEGSRLADGLRRYARAWRRRLRAR